MFKYILMHRQRKVDGLQKSETRFIFADKGLFLKRMGSKSYRLAQKIHNA